MPFASRLPLVMFPTSFTASAFSGVQPSSSCSTTAFTVFAPFAFSAAIRFFPSTGSSRPVSGFSRSTIGACSVGVACTGVPP